MVFDRFVEFCRYEKLTGGPDPHMRAVLALCKELPIEEQIWRSALYVGVYNVPSAEAIWREWPIEKALRHPDRLYEWLEWHWRFGIRTRRERRSCNTPTKFMEYLQGVQRTLDEPLAELKSLEDVWQFAMSLPRVGRYAATKLTELWAQLGLTRHHHIDIRAKGGWSPRTTLVLFNPALPDPYDDRPMAVAETEAYAMEVLREFPFPLTVFEFEVLLCEFKSSLIARRQYPGRSLDSELGYELAIRPYWGVVNTEHMAVRPLLSPQWALGEVQGWYGPREELGYVLADYDYTWSDSLFNYHATTDFKHPVRHADS